MNAREILTGFYINPKTDETRSRDMHCYPDVFERMLKARDIRYTRIYILGTPYIAVYNDRDLSAGYNPLSSLVYKTKAGCTAHIRGRVFIFKGFGAPDEPQSLSPEDIKRIKSRVIVSRNKDTSERPHKALLID